VKNHHHHENYHNLKYPIYLSKFIPFRFCIWKIAKTKSLSHVVKKWYLDCEYAQIVITINQKVLTLKDIMNNMPINVH